MNAILSTVRPELVEGQLFLLPRIKGQGFDKLSPNGILGAANG